MKRLYKRLLAVVLCLALTATIVPGTVFALEGEPTPEEIAYWVELGYVPGEVMVTLYEPYYSVDDEVYGNLADILPEIEIESYKDSYLCFLTEAQRKTLSKDKPEYAALVGQSFLIKLVDKTPEATEAAVEALKNNSHVKSVDKNACGEALDIIQDDGPEYSVADALYVLRVAAGLFTPEVGEDLDKDGDGAVTVADALIVLRIAAKLA